MPYVVNWFGVTDDSERVLIVERDPDADDNAQNGIYLSPDLELVCTFDAVEASDNYGRGWAISVEGALRVLLADDSEPAGSVRNGGYLTSVTGQLCVTTDAVDHYIAGIPVNVYGAVCVEGGTPPGCTITAYDSQAAFLLAVTDPGTDTYDDLTPGLGPATYNRTAGTHSYLASALTALLAPSTFFPIDGGGGDIWLGATDAPDFVKFSNFSAGVKGVGGFFFNTDASGNPTAFPCDLTITVVLEDATEHVYTLTSPTPTTFLGFVTSCSFTSITIAPTPPNENPVFHWATINDLILGSAGTPATDDRITGDSDTRITGDGDTRITG